jgi:mannose-6-phosphate isomerase-like protein (cupin superfamily)
MRGFIALGVALFGVALACTRSANGVRLPSSPSVAVRGTAIEYDSVVAKREPGPHAGGGETTAYSFFSDEPSLPLVFRKRSLHPGSAIGYHRNGEDEIYYVLSGRGELTLNGERREVGPGTAIMTRAGNSHGLRQIGTDDLVILISYQRGLSG